MGADPIPSSEHTEQGCVRREGARPRSPLPCLGMEERGPLGSRLPWGVGFGAGKGGRPRYPQVFSLGRAVMGGPVGDLRASPVSSGSQDSSLTLMIHSLCDLGPSPHLLSLPGPSCQKGRGRAHLRPWEEPWVASAPCGVHVGFGGGGSGSSCSHAAPLPTLPSRPSLTSAAGGGAG